jgi:carboxyl-terminal processing protease
MARVIGPVNTAMLTARNIKDGKSDKAVSRTGDDAPRFGQINLTMAKFYRINGSSTQHKGVMPDVEFPMVFPADDFGESSEPTALPWDTIEPSDYTRVGNLDPIKRQLISLHDTRMKTSLDYKNLQEDIREFKKRAGETSVTLNEAQLKKERDEKEASNLARDNARRASQGLPPLKKGEVKPKNDIDFLRDESLKIMGDFMQIKQ